jgi:urease accessory protein
MLMASPPRVVPESLPEALRARGGVRLVVGPTPRGPAPLTIAESGGYRVRFPKAPGACEGVLINTGGGMTGGDRMALDATVLAGAACTLTTQAAEKIYRSDGPGTEVAIRLVLEPGSRLAWLPQEQILFDGARLSRTLDVGMAPDAALTLVESAVFGRLAMGETLGKGAFRDRWRLRRDGRLVFAEEVRLEGGLGRALSRPAVGAGARAVATVLHLAPGAAALLEPARAALEDATCECGASALDDLLVVRFLSADPQALRASLARVLETFRGAPLPRSWQC